MISSFGSLVLIRCDETDVGRRCAEMIECEYGIAAAVSSARAEGWRAYADSRRRVLCPMHRAAASRRLTLIKNEEFAWLRSTPSPS